MPSEVRQFSSATLAALRSWVFAVSGGIPRLQAHHRYDRHQLFSLHPQVRQRKQHQHLRGVPGQTAIAHLDVTKLALDHPKRVFHITSTRSPAPGLGPNRRCGYVLAHAGKATELKMAFTLASVKGSPVLFASGVEITRIPANGWNAFDTAIPI